MYYVSLSYVKINVQICFCFNYTLGKHAHIIYRFFLSCKTLKFSTEKNAILLIFAQNIDSGYTLESPHLAKDSDI